MDTQGSDFICTFSGERFYPLAPRPENVLLVDIAHALSMICRYNGHLRFFYSVGQHSLLAMQVLKELGYGVKMQLYGMFHDSSEAYIHDLTTPFKRVLEQYKPIEQRVQDVIWAALRLPIPTAEEYAIVKEVDLLLLREEGKVLIPSVTATTTLEYTGPLRIERRAMEEIELEFYQTAIQLLQQYGKECSDDKEKIQTA